MKIFLYILFLLALFVGFYVVSIKGNQKQTKTGDVDEKTTQNQNTSEKREIIISLLKNKVATLNAERNNNMRISTKAKVIIGVIVVTIILLFTSITMISAGHTGVVSVFGKVSSEVLDEGIHFKAPWQQVTQIDNRIVKLEVETESSSKDLQSISTTVAVSYRVDSKMSYSIIKNIGKGYEEILVTPAVNETLKAVTAKYTAEECITNRNKVSQELVTNINEKLNVQGISVNDVNIIDFKFSEAFDKAIEEKQVAEQQLKKAETEKQEAIVKATAEAEKKKVSATADAEATLTKAKAQAEANEKLNNSLSKNLIDYNTIQKWNGELPKVNGSNGTIIDGSSLFGDANNDKK